MLTPAKLATIAAAGFWENYGYNIYRDPWREQRYAGD
jgi:DMSO/TMAO reductase YedYZ molybdopterin-dependent catalytic subunit